MNKEEIRNSIKEIIKPHFGYLSMYQKWVMSGEMLVDDVEEFNDFVKKYKNIIRKLGKPLNNYNSYYRAMSDIVKLRKEEEVKRVFKDGLNGSSRQFFRKTFDTHKKLYMRLFKDDFKMQVFFRNSSKPHTIEDYIVHLERSLHFSSDMTDVIDRVEEKFDYVRTRNNAYLFELKESMLDMVPNTWCMYQSVSDYEREKRSRNLHSIWLLVDPYEQRNDRKIVGIDVPDDFGTILYMDSLNNRFTNDLPITEKEFYKLTDTMIDKPSSEEIDFIVNSFLKDMEKDSELEKKVDDNTLFGKFWNSRY